MSGDMEKTLRKVADNGVLVNKRTFIIFLSPFHLTPSVLASKRKQKGFNMIVFDRIFIWIYTK